MGKIALRLVNIKSNDKFPLYNTEVLEDRLYKTGKAIHSLSI